MIFNYHKTLNTETEVWPEIKLWPRIYEHSYAWVTPANLVRRGPEYGQDTKSLLVGKFEYITITYFLIKFYGKLPKKVWRRTEWV